MDEQATGANGHSPFGIGATRILRLFALLWVAISFIAFQFFDLGQVGDSMEWKDGKTSISVGSHPAVLLWAVVAVGLFVVIMVRKPGMATEGVPAGKRRVLAFMIDFWFSLVAVSGIGALIPLLLEAQRTGHFAWRFQRNYSTASDSLAVFASLAFMGLMVLYFAFPLTRGRQTVGCLILRLKLAPPFGSEGCFTWKAALIRTYYAFVGGISIFRKWDRDDHGRTWYDRKTNTTVVFVDDD